MRDLAFRRGVVKPLTLLGCYTAYISSWLSSKIGLLDCFTLEDGIDMMRRNVGHQLPTSENSEDLSGFKTLEGHK
jgi:hypothetical protein